MLLNETIIRQHLHAAGFTLPLICHVLNTVDSTNQYLKDLPASAEWALCCAETQTQGRGRFHRTWFSPQTENIYCSIRWQMVNPSMALSALTLVVGLAVLQTLRDLAIHQDIAIKWPNDILWQGKKLCGILTESTQKNQEDLQIIVGIGLNVNSDSQQYCSQAAPTRPWCSLYDITHTIHDRNAIIAKLVMYTQQYITTFITEGFAPFLPLWHASDYLYQKAIHVTHAQQNLQGFAQGITAQGELIVIDQAQRTHYVTCGEASIGNC